MNTKTVAFVLIAVMILLACPCLAVSGSEAETQNRDTQHYLSVLEMREILELAGIDVEGFSDSDIEARVGWWANKDLIGKYAYDDYTGLNWLLKEAGVMTEISEIVTLSDGAYSIVADGLKIVVRGVALPISLLVDAGSIISVYTDEMQKCAMEKADIAAKLIAEGENYAVYETWVMWHTIPNGYGAPCIRACGRE